MTNKTSLQCEQYKHVQMIQGILNPVLGTWTLMTVGRGLEGSWGSNNGSGSLRCDPGPIPTEGFYWILQLVC